MTRRDWMLAMAGALTMPAVARAQASRLVGDDVTALTLSALVARFERRELSPADVTEAYLARIARLNPDLNAFVTVTGDRARADASRASRILPPAPGTAPVPTPLLLGAPIAHKDLFETSAIRTTAGSRLHESYVPKRDAFVVSQLARASAVLLGKTNTHELGGGVTTINPFYGTTRNPVDRLRIPGGSSGGSAAAVVARLSVAATGSDTGGSVRIPAALCGCVGFKPTFGLISTAGLLGSCPTFDHVGFLARTVEDAAVIFAAALDKPDQPPLKLRRSAEASAKAEGLSPRPPVGPGRVDKPSGLSNRGGDKPLGLSGVHIGVLRPFFFDGLQRDVARAMEIAIQRFGSIGAGVEEVALPIDGSTMSSVFDPIVVSEIWSSLGDAWRRRPDAFSKGFAGFFETPAPAAAEVAASRRALSDFRAAVDRLFDRVQILLTPTVPITAPPIEGRIDGGLILRNTWAFNAAGTPAISIPCGVDAAGLPIGLQLAARRQHDQLLLKVGGAFEHEITR
jgi:aspartyl-tRNA(Asn)/glutamyl-tRNA(Gln) amidotransferase subunit A